MIKHVIKYKYITGENPIAKNGTAIIEFPKQRDETCNSLWIVLQQKLLDSHTMLIKKFPSMNFGVPNLIEVNEVKILHNETNV